MKHLVVIAATYPGSFSGHAIALKTSIDALYERFETISYFVALKDVVKPKHPNLWGDKITFYEVGASRTSLARRYLNSMGSMAPAICQQYLGASIRWEFEALFQSIIQRHGQPDRILIEHLPVALLLSLRLRKAFAGKMVIRSHDVLTDAFSTFTKEGTLFSRLAWTYELKRIQRFEKQMLSACSCFCAITKADAYRYKQMFGGTMPDVLGVAIDSARFDSVAPGSQYRVVHIGGADLRKAHGLNKFVHETWPIVKSAAPSAELVMAGYGSERFSNRAASICGYGAVEDDLEIFGKGMIFVNPQEAGSGVKIKSLNAMAAGRALVSTENGVLGIDAKEGVDFVMAKNSKTMANEIVRLMESPNICRVIGGSGRETIIKKYNIKTIASDFQSVFTKIGS